MEIKIYDHNGRALIFKRGKSLCENNTICFKIIYNNNSEACKYYRQAANQGHVEAKVNLERLYHKICIKAPHDNSTISSTVLELSKSMSDLMSKVTASNVEKHNTIKDAKIQQVKFGKNGKGSKISYRPKF